MLWRSVRQDGAVVSSHLCMSVPTAVCRLEAYFTGPADLTSYLVSLWCMCALYPSLADVALIHSATCHGDDVTVGAINKYMTVRSSTAAGHLGWCITN